MSGRASATRATRLKSLAGPTVPQHPTIPDWACGPTPDTFLSALGLLVPGATTANTLLQLSGGSVLVTVTVVLEMAAAARARDVLRYQTPASLGRVLGGVRPSSITPPLPPPCTFPSAPPLQPRLLPHLHSNFRVPRARSALVPLSFDRRVHANTLTPTPRASPHPPHPPTHTPAAPQSEETLPTA